MNKHTGRWNEWSSRWILERCVRHGVKDVVLCPGSRSTPLALAASQIEELTVHVHFDERGAAFFAMGLSRSDERPVVWITTSGTAVANGLPGVVEASQNRIPLILLTADRPPELRGCGANQAIDQVNIFGSYCRYFKDMSCSNPDMSQGWYEREVDRALHAAHQPGCEGPVHLNLMIREPLLAENEASKGGSGRGIEPDLRVTQSHPPIPTAQRENLRQQVLAAHEGMLVIGSLRTQAEKDAALAFANELGWPCVADVASGLRFHENIPTQIRHIDLLLHHEKMRWAQPEVVLWIGGSLVSKRLLDWMGRESRSELLRLSANRLQEDPLHRASSFFVCSLELELPTLIEKQTVNSSTAWVEKWKKADGCIGSELAQPDLMGGGKISQLEAAQLVSDLRGPAYAVFAGNSLSIRELDQVGGANTLIKYVSANRGASGIDGLIASAAGDAKAHGLPSLAYMGDLSFLHDLNSLALLRQVKTPFILLVVNNDGGGIFHFLPALDEVEDFEKVFSTPHGVSFKAAAELFDLPYSQPTTLTELREVLRNGLATPGPQVVEIQTDRQQTRSGFTEFAETISRLPLK